MSRFSLLSMPGTVGISLSALLSPLAAFAQDINTGDPNGAYHATFCPRVEGELKTARFSVQCKTSQGTAENIKRVMADPRQVGFGQLDILALDGVLTGSPAPITIVRRDDARECVFAVTRNKDVNAWGELAAHAAKLRFILPPADSGSAGTFRFLKSVDVEGLGKAGQVSHAATTDEAIRQALSADDTVTLFVQFPDPENARFKLVKELGGHFVPVIDRAILRPQISGEKVYFAQETQVANASWSKSGEKVVTSCTPLTIFTGAPERVSGDKAQQDHRDLIATVKAMKTDALLPPEGAFSKFWRRTKEISGTSTEQMIKFSEEAREKAKPMMERAKEMGEKAMDKAKQEAKELIDAVKPPAGGQPGETKPSEQK